MLFVVDTVLPHPLALLLIKIVSFQGFSLNKGNLPDQFVEGFFLLELKGVNTVSCISLDDNADLIEA